ncbi:two-partner secretion domain-containing protein [Nostoc commune]|nr:filamentous hemagglutinin N-terminal domain-containing protein [Nostoc commune]
MSIRWGWFLGIAICGSSIGRTNCAFAQIIPDGTLLNNSTVKLEGNNSIIEGGTQAGGNLFHSFREFSVPPNGAALFNNAADIQNIISRVTGGSASNIDGLIYANGIANLFLINPNGIVFGKNAQLNVGGSFVASTANALQFGNRGFFSASEKNIPSPLLTINPSALLFNQINQNAVIQNNSVAPAGQDPAGFDGFGLRVANGKSLLLVGGNINMDGGGLNANGGRVELGGLSEPGTVALGVDGDNLSLRFPENVTRADISFTNRAGVFVEAAGGGNIAVNVKNLEILGGSILSGGIGQGLGTPKTVAGDITLNATEEIKVAAGSVVRNLVRFGSLGNGGNITIDSGSLSLGDRAQLEASTYGQGNAGNVKVSAKDAVSLVNSNIFSSVERGGVGKGGNIDINAATMSLIDDAQLVTLTRTASATQPAGRGDAGNVNVNVTGIVDIAGGQNGVSGIGSLVQPGTVGNGGNITIDSGSLSLRDGAQLSASTFGEGNAGNVTVRTRDAVDLADALILSTVAEGGVGKGGNIDINAAKVSLIDGAILTTETSGQGNAGNVTVSAKNAVDLADALILSTAQLATLINGVSDTQSAGGGDGGNITINSGSFSLRNGAQLTASTFGQGNAGNITVLAKDAVNLANGGIFSQVYVGGVGKGGNIDINAAKVLLSDDAILQASTFGQGNAGNVTVHAKNSVDLADANIFSTVEAGGVGKGGNIDINAAKVSLTDGASLQTTTRGASDTQLAGLEDSGILSQVETGTVANGGNITIDSSSFSLRDGAFLATSTLRQGNAGNVTVRAKNAVDLADANIFSTVEAGGVGKGGNIDINAATLSLIDGAQLQTTSRGASDTQPAGRGDAGNVNINVTGSVDIAGGKNDFLRSGIRSNLETETEGNGGNISIDSGSFSLKDGAILTASTAGQGNAGNVTVRAKNAVDLADNAYILSTVEAGSVGKSGNIDINAAKLSLIDGAQLLTLTRGASANQPPGRGDAGNVNVNVTGSVDIAREKKGFTSGILSLVETGTEGNGGNITIDSGFFSLSDGGVLSAQTLGQGNAGTIKVNAANFFTISGKSANFTSGLFVNSESPTGTAGDIIVTSPRVTLDNGGTLNAQSASGNGGNINLQTDLLLLRRGASITTTAGTAEAGGNGGNINIDAPSGFIVAVPNENSDITANAYTGSGGRVNIRAFGIYGIQPRSNPTSLSDITASSEFGVNGTVELNTPDIDPNSGLVNLPTIPVDTQVAQTCQAGGNLAKSSFTITGRGGLPPNPGEALNTDAVKVDLVSLNPNADNPDRSFVPSKITTPAPEPIIEATGLALNQKGEVVLTANLPTTTPHSPWLKPASCRVS